MPQTPGPRCTEVGGDADYIIICDMLAAALLDGLEGNGQVPQAVVQLIKSSEVGWCIARSPINILEFVADGIITLVLPADELVLTALMSLAELAVHVLHAAGLLGGGLNGMVFYCLEHAFHAE